ncbi:adenylyl cyclase [Streptomyces sp. NPDC051561]|uniref:adenylyl cyclase n=1 Tax=Streptomyces sp. NPDC051561 TaxID=3365658 RepID=UPI0037A62465
MKREYEVKFLDVDAAGLQVELSRLSAVQVLPRTLITRKFFEGRVLRDGASLRLRNEGTRSALVLRQGVDGGEEIATEVGDLRAASKVLCHLGLHESRYQENYREGWVLGEVAFVFEIWPDLPPFVAVKGPDEATVRQAAALLGLDLDDARSGGVHDIYRSEAGRNILVEPTLLFADAVPAQGN